MKAVKQEGNIEEGQIAAGYSKLFPKLFPRLHCTAGVLAPIPERPREIEDLGAELGRLPACLLCLHGKVDGRVRQDGSGRGERVGGRRREAVVGREGGVGGRAVGA